MKREFATVYAMHLISLMEKKNSKKYISQGTISIIGGKFDAISSRERLKYQVYIYIYIDFSRNFNPCRKFINSEMHEYGQSTSIPMNWELEKELVGNLIYRYISKLIYKKRVYTFVLEVCVVGIRRKSS